MNGLVAFGGQFRKQLIEFRRYVFETLSGILTLFGFFVMLFLGARAVGGRAPGFGETLEGIVVAFAVWTIAIFAYQSLVQGLVMEAQQGTLEQLAMSPVGLVRVLLGQVAAGLAFQLVMMSVLLVLMMGVTGKWLHIDVVSILPLLLVTLLGLVGLGFAMGGLAIVFKRVQGALQIVQVFVLALVAVPPESVPMMRYLPLAWGTSLLRRVMVDGTSLFSIPAGDLLFLVANSAVWFTAGVGVFKAFEGVARNRDLLGHY